MKIDDVFVDGLGGVVPVPFMEDGFIGIHGFPVKAFVSRGVSVVIVVPVFFISPLYTLVPSQDTTNIETMFMEKTLGQSVFALKDGHFFGGVVDENRFFFS